MIKNCSRLTDIFFKVATTLGLIGILASAGGCTKNEFDLEFKLPETINTTYTVSYYASDKRGGAPVESAVAVAAGKGSMKGMTVNPTVVSIYYQRGELPACVVYADRGDKIVMEGTSENPEEWNVSGNKVNGKLSEFRRDNRGLINEVSRNSGESAREIHKRLNSVVEKYVKGHSDELASLIILTIYYDAKIDAAGFLRLQKDLEKAGVMEKGAKLMPAISRQDMLTATELAPGMNSKGGLKVKDMIVKSYERNLDTIKAASGKKPILIYLWRRNDEDHKRDIDSLKRVAKWRGDSAGMPIVDICLDSDSTSWTYALKNDSLRSVLHAWMPRGIADKTMMELGVNGSPWWIVIGSDGKMQMSGKDGKSAIEKFKKWKK